MKEIKYNLGPAYYKGGATRDNLDGWLSKSMLWQFAQSPYKWMFGPPKKVTDAMTFGTAVHALTFQPDEIDEFFAVCPYDDFRKKEAREWKVEAEASGKEIVKQATLDHAQRIADQVLDSEELFSFGDYDAEVAVYDEIQGHPVRGMIDILPKHGGAICDLKTTQSIGSHRDIQSKVVGLGYHMQAALYLDLYNSVSGESRDEFKFLFVETDAPHETALVTLRGEWLDLGRTAYMNAIAKWNQCKAAGHFPMRHSSEIVLELPKWATYD